VGDEVEYLGVVVLGLGQVVEILDFFDRERE